MKSQKEILEEIVRKLRSGGRIISTGIGSDFELNLFSEVETILKSALEVLSKEVVGRASRTLEYFKREYGTTQHYSRLVNSY